MAYNFGRVLPSDAIMRKIISHLYPFFFAIYPILELRNHNAAYVELASLYRPILLSVALTGLLWGLLRLFIRDWQRAAVIVTLAIILFFSYGHIYLQYQATFGEPPRHRFLALIFVAIFLLLDAWIIWKVRDTKDIVNFLTVTGGVLVAFSLFSTLQNDISTLQKAMSSQNPRQMVTDGDSSIQKPDIYFILLDGHTRSDILLKYFDYDNSAFIQQLKDRGFYVAECAQSNYPATKLSVTSTFYGDYHKEPNLYPVFSSMTIQTVRSLGYKVITFENRSNGHFDMSEDMRLSRNTMAFGRIDLTGGLSEFEMMLINTTALRIAVDMPQLVPGLDKQMLQKTEYDEHYQQTFYILDELGRLPDDAPSPKFVFAHILVPHPPYIFAADGEYRWMGDAKKGYAENTGFIDSHLIPVLDEIIQKSEIPPIIIIMGDHGPSGEPLTPEKRMPILNAYYVNDAAKQDLYETITPVNSFRVVFDHYFGMNYPLLEDKSYFAYEIDQSDTQHLFPNKCQAGQ